MLNEKKKIGPVFVVVFVIVFAFYSVSNFSFKNVDNKRIFYINDLEQELIDKVKYYLDFELDDYYLVHMHTIKDDIRYIYRVDNGVRKEVEDIYYDFENHKDRTSDTLVFLRKKTEEIKLIYIRNDKVVVVTSVLDIDNWKRHEQTFKIDLK